MKLVTRSSSLAAGAPTFPTLALAAGPPVITLGPLTAPTGATASGSADPGGQADSLLTGGHPMHALLAPPTPATPATEDGYVEFWPAGTRAAGEYRCVACGYGLVTHRTLPSCPACAHGLWEQDDWSPFTRMAGKH